MNHEMPTVISASYARPGSVSSHTLAAIAAEVPAFASESDFVAGYEGVLKKDNATLRRPLFKTYAAAPKQEKYSMRIVRVYIADTDQNLPIMERLLHRGEEQITDLTDQELFFGVRIGELLEEHNKKRAATLNKSAAEKAGKDVHLEPIRIRDLKMVVLNVAEF